MRPDAPLPWTDAEDAQIREIYPSRGSIPLLAKMPERTRAAITRRAQRLGIACHAFKRNNEDAIHAPAPLYPRDPVEAACDAALASYRCVNPLPLRWSLRA